MRHRSRRVVVVGLVAAHTGCRQRRVVAADMASRASRGHMRPGQRERCVVVIERRIGPRHHVMAQLACRRETRVRHRRGGVVIVGLVAADARRVRDVVVVADMAIRAQPRRRGVRPR